MLNLQQRQVIEFVAQTRGSSSGMFECRVKSCNVMIDTLGPLEEYMFRDLSKASTAPAQAILIVSFSLPDMVYIPGTISFFWRRTPGPRTQQMHRRQSRRHGKQQCQDSGHDSWVCT